MSGSITNPGSTRYLRRPSALIHDIHEQTVLGLIPTDAFEPVVQPKDSAGWGVGFIIHFRSSGMATGPLDVEDAQRKLFGQHGIPTSMVFIDRTELSGPRPSFESALANLGPGGTLAVDSLHRLGSSARSVVLLLARIEGRGANLRILSEGIDTSTDRGAHFRTDLGILAGVELAFLRERQALGIARAKRDGKYAGRAPTAQNKAEEVYRLRDSGLTYAKIADALGISEASAYQINKKRFAERSSNEKRLGPLPKGGS